MTFIFYSAHANLPETCSIEGGDSSSKRMEIKHLIRELKKTNPFVEGNIFKSVENVEIEHHDRLQAERSEASLLESYDEVAESRDVKQ